MLPPLLLCSLSGSLRYTLWRCWLSLPMLNTVSWDTWWRDNSKKKKWKQSSQKDSQVLCEQPGNAKAKLYITVCDMLASLFFLLLWSFSTVTVMLNMSEHSRPNYLTFLLCSFYVLNCLASIFGQPKLLSVGWQASYDVYFGINEGMFFCIKAWNMHCGPKRWLNLAYSILKNVISFNLHNKIFNPKWIYQKPFGSFPDKLNSVIERKFEIAFR